MVAMPVGICFRVAVAVVAALLDVGVEPGDEA